MIGSMRNRCRSSVNILWPVFQREEPPFTSKKATVSFSSTGSNLLSSPFHVSAPSSSPILPLCDSCPYHSLPLAHLTSGLCTYRHDDHYPFQRHPFYKQSRRFYRTQAPVYYSTPDATTETSEPFGRRMLKLVGWMGGFYSRKAILGRAAKSLYERSIDNINYEQFFKVCSMPDNFQSWFLVSHLHVWLLMVRLKREGKEGNYLIRELMTTFWEDVDSRMRLLGVRNMTSKKRAMPHVTTFTDKRELSKYEVHGSQVASQSKKELLQQFYGVTVAYEEGLLSNDKVLAAAIWRNLVGDQDKTDPVQLAKMVEYVRKQVLYMDKLDSGPLKETGAITLLPF